MAEDLLPSWRPGTARDALVAFLDAVLEVPVEERVACFDNDGTLWCERPTYVQFDFFVDALKSGRARRPEHRRRPRSSRRCSPATRPPSASSAWSGSPWR